MLGVEAPVGNHHNHGQVQYLRMQLQKASGLSKQPVLEPRLGVHLHLQQHHGPICRTGLPRSRPERAIQAMVHRFELSRVRAIKRIARRIQPKRGHCRGIGSTLRRQQQRDQIGRTLKQAIEPVIRFQGPPPGIARLTTKSIVRQY